MEEAFNYLLVDLRPEQDKDLRLRANIFPGDSLAIRVEISRAIADLKGMKRNISVRRTRICVRRVARKTSLTKKRRSIENVLFSILGVPVEMSQRVKTFLRHIRILRDRGRRDYGVKSVIESLITTDDVRPQLDVMLFVVQLLNADIDFVQ